MAAAGPPRPLRCVFSKGQSRGQRSQTSLGITQPRHLPLGPVPCPCRIPAPSCGFGGRFCAGFSPGRCHSALPPGSVPSAPRLPGAGRAPRRPRIETVRSGSGPGAPRAQGRPANGWPDPPRHPTDRSCRCLSLSSRRRPHGTGGTCATRRDQSADVLELGFGMGRAGLLVRAETGCGHAAVSLKGGGHAWAGATGAPRSRLVPQAALPRARPARSTHDTEPRVRSRLSGRPAGPRWQAGRTGPLLLWSRCSFVLPGTETFSDHDAVTSGTVGGVTVICQMRPNIAWPRGRGPRLLLPSGAGPRSSRPAGTVGQPVAGSAEAPAPSRLRKLGCSSGCSLCTECIGGMALGAQELSYVGPETKN